MYISKIFGGSALEIKKIDTEETHTFLEKLIFQYMLDIKDFMMIFKVVLFVTTKNWKQPNVPQWRDG